MHHSRPWVVLMTFMGLAWILSMFCSNTATTVMLVPFARSLLDTAKVQVQASIDESRNPNAKEMGMGKLAALRRFELGVLLGICYAATVGGIATLIGTAPNGVLAGQPILAGQVDFANWFAFAFPISLFMILVVYLTLYVMYIHGVTISLDATELSAARDALGPLTRDEVVVALTLLLQIIGFFIRPYALKALFPGINDASVAVFTAIILFLVPSSNRPGEAVLTWEAAQVRTRTHPNTTARLASPRTQIRKPQQRAHVCTRIWLSTLRGLVLTFHAPSLVPRLSHSPICPGASSFSWVGGLLSPTASPSPA